MSKLRQRALKAVEKFRKNAEKEAQRAKDLRRKYEDFAPRQETAPLLAQFLDRVKQKELQASGELLWADQFVEQLRVAMPKKGKDAPATNEPPKKKKPK